MQKLHSGRTAKSALRRECKYCVPGWMKNLHAGGQSAESARQESAKTARHLSAKIARDSISLLFNDSY